MQNNLSEKRWCDSCGKVTNWIDGECEVYIKEKQGHLSYLQIAIYAVNCSNSNESVDEVAKMIESYANSEHDKGFSLGY